MKMRLGPIVGALVLGAAACGVEAPEVAAPVQVAGAVQTPAEPAVAADHSGSPSRVAFAAAAGTACYTESGSADTMIGEPGTIDLAGFDGRGPLVSVAVTTSVGGKSIGSYTNRGFNPYLFFIDTSSRFTGSITGPGGVSSSYGGGVNIYEVTIPTGGTETWTVNTTAATATQTPADLTAYQVSTVSFALSSSGDFVNNANADGDLTIDSAFTASAIIEYCYTTAGSIGITKTVTADPGATLGTFDFEVSCASGFTTTVHIEGEGSIDVEGMDADDTCSVTEVFSGDQSGRWVVSVGGVCEIVEVTGLALGDSAEFNNRLWGGAYDECAAAG